MNENTANNGSIESRKDFKDTPKGQYQYYAEELGASTKMLQKWHKMADKIVKKYLGDNTSTQKDMGTFKLNLFHSNITTLQSMMYGNTPKIAVDRQYTDQNDDAGRVAATTIQRLLSLDIQQNGEEVDSVLQSALSDRLLAGLGCARVRYDMKTAMVDGEEQVMDESAPIDYFHWGDVMWSWARNWSEVRWIAFRSYMTKDEVKARFGEQAGNNVPLKQQKMATDEETSNQDAETDSAWKKAEVWEIWDKEKRKVVWLCFGYDKVLETKDDPLQLENFYPVPPFLLANPTTSLYLPTPDYKLAEDLYNEIDKLQERISIITEAVKVVGVYDSSSEEIKKMMNNGTDNQLIPVSNWAVFGEKQGLKGQVDWLPIADVVNALDKLRDMRSEAIGLLQQITGMSDIMRGELGSAYEGVGQSEMKAKFGSMRVQALQEQFAKFASDLFQIKAEIISKHFSPQTIAQKSNMQHSVDVDLLPQAIEIIKNYKQAQLRVKIRPESIAMADYAQLKSERTEYINALAVFMQSASPIMEQDPSSKPFLLQLLQWGLAGFKGANEIEGVLDKAIEAAQKAQDEDQGGKTDPAMAAAQLAIQQEQLKQQGEKGKIAAKAEADAQLREQDFMRDMQLAQQQHAMKLEEIEADMQRSLAETQAKLEADLLMEKVETQSNLVQTNATIEGEIRKDATTAELDIITEAAKTGNKIQEIREAAAHKIKETTQAAKKATTKESKDD